MAEHIEPKAAPKLSLPASSSLVTVNAIDSTLLMAVNAANFIEPSIPGHEIYNATAVSFLVTHQKTGRRVVFDFGLRKDYWNFAPLLVNGIKNTDRIKGIKCEKGVQDVLVDAGVKLEDIEALIWR